MKRVLLAAFGIALAAAAIALLARRDRATISPAGIPPAATRELTTADSESTLEGDREGRESANRSEGAGVAPAVGKESVRGLVVFARTGAAVGGGAAQIWYTLTSGTLEPDMVEVQVARDGRFALDLPIGARVTRVRVAPSQNRFLSSRGTEAAADLFVARAQSVDQEVRQEGIDVRIAVDGTLELRGVVRDAETLAPIEGARLSIAGIANSPAMCLSKQDGSFVLSGFLPDARGGRQPVRVEHLGYLPARHFLEADALAAGAPPVTLELRRGTVVEGSILDERGQPVPGVVLRLLVRGFEGTLDSGACVVSDRSDARGHFRCAPVAPCSSLAIDIEGGWHHERDYLPLHQDLGALQADRNDLRIELRASRMIEVRASLADGTPLGPRDFEVVCANSPCVEPSGYGPEGVFLRVPPGVDLELEAYASANDERDPELFVRGAQSASVESDVTKPPVLRIVLTDRGGFTVPLPHIGICEIVLPGPAYLRAAADVQLLDAGGGQPLGKERSVQVSMSGRTLVSTRLRGGWLRVRARPGRYVLEVEVDGGPRDVMDLLIPASGYGRTEWRVRLGP